MHKTNTHVLFKNCSMEKVYMRKINDRKIRRNFKRKVKIDKCTEHMCGRIRTKDNKRKMKVELFDVFRLPIS